MDNIFQLDEEEYIFHEIFDGEVAGEAYRTSGRFWYARTTF